LLTKFPGIATSGRHNSAMITHRRKFTSKWSLYEMSCFHFTVRITSQSFPLAARSIQKSTYPKFRQRPMSDIAY